MEIRQVMYISFNKKNIFDYIFLSNLVDDINIYLRYEG
jgi:hypothetical protein